MVFNRDVDYQELEFLNKLTDNQTENYEPLIFVATEDSTITLSGIGSPFISGLQYRTELLSSWENYTINTSIPMQPGEMISFRNTNGFLSIDYQNYVQFIIDGSFIVTGRVDALINYSDYSDYCFYSLFNGCSGLMNAPKLSETMLTVGCYSNMFNGCTSLNSMPELPAMVLKDNCYSKMFMGCSSLISSAYLPATISVSGCYSNMFNECSSLSSVNVGLKKYNENDVENWLSGINTSGILICQSSLLINEDVMKNKDIIPNSWKIVNNIEEYNINEDKILIIDVGVKNLCVFSFAKIYEEECLICKNYRWIYNTNSKCIKFKFRK